jgi:hypothetical protein
MVDGFQAVFQSAGTLVGTWIRELVAIGGGAGEAHGQRAEIVQGLDTDDFFFLGFENSGPETEADTVTEFGGFETYLCQFGQHFVAVIVPGRVPTGGHGQHGFHAGSFKFKVLSYKLLRSCALLRRDGGNKKPDPARSGTGFL